MSQKNQSSSNDTNYTFGAKAAPAQAISDTPGSHESGGGGTVSYRATGSVASTNSFTVVNQADAVRGGSAQKINIGKISSCSEVPCYGRWQQWPEPVGHGHAGG